MGGDSSFLQLFLANQLDLKAFIGSLLRDPTAVDDVFQEVSLTLFEKFDAFDQSRSFGHWARGVAMNKIRQRWDRQAQQPAPFPPETITAIIDAFDRQEQAPSPRMDALSHCMEELPPRSQQMLGRRYGDGWSLQQIAESINSSRAAVRKALYRIRVALAECIEKQTSADAAE